MRDVLLALFVAYAVVRALQHPWIGILAWTLLSIMNLHRYSWVLASMPVAAAIAGATLVGLLLSKDRKSLPATRETVLLIMLMAWFCTTLPFSFNFEASLDQWKKVMKIDLMILVAIMVLHTRKHIMALAWVLAVSIGFYGFKGGLFTLATGGAYRVWGPEGTYIEGNNELALALVTIIPILRFLQLNAPQRWVRLLLMATMVLSAVAALGSHSRGALIAIATMAFVMWWRSESKSIAGVFMAVAGVAMLAFMPDIWVARMESIGDYQDDRSAMGRINAWRMAWNLASHNFFGGGFQIYDSGVFARYAPDPDMVHAAHSVYFQILGEHGFVGLFLFLLMWLMVWLTAGRLRHEGKARPETLWVSQLASMCQVSMAGYTVGGAFLSLAYFDLPYNLLVLLVVASRWLQTEGWRTDDVAAPARAPNGKLTVRA